MEKKDYNQKYENYEGKDLISKGKYTVNVVYQSLTKLVGSLKDKNNKII